MVAGHTSTVNKIWLTRSAPVVVFLLAACNRNREPQPSVSSVGSWQGTLTTVTGSSGTQPFTAEITEVDGTLYEGVFTVDKTVYNVSGHYDGGNQNGERFTLTASPPELRATVSDPFPYGFNWLGLMTETEYAGDWYVYEYPNRERSSEGTFSLERAP